MRLKVGAATNIGRVRPTNEDAFFADADRGLFVVCDGMGGEAAGEVASRMAVDTISSQLLQDGRPAADGDQDDYRPRTRQLAHAVQDANRAIYDRAQSHGENAGMGTTVVGAWFGDGVVSVAHVGDSRAYLCTRANFEGITTDHSLVEAQVQAGVIDREQSLHSQHQNILLRALGRDPSVEVTLTEVPVATGDRLLLCSDGLTRMVRDEQLARALERYPGDPQQACDHLIEAANANGGPDNITVVIIEFQGSRLGTMLGRLTR